MNYYVVYKKNQIIRGPLSQELASTTVEDLDFALEDPGYQAMSESDLRTLGLLK